MTYQRYGLDCKNQQLGDTKIQREFECQLTVSSPIDKLAKLNPSDHLLRANIGK